ncbi:hypothetical protein FPQ18DRAFT_312966 [Pyronema domesticum]|nr:hypothetical protein FPQ18DRAFT_312966 [Pyronema domesticum]
MISPATSLAIDWTCLAVTISIGAARLYIQFTRAKRREISHYDTELILILVFVLGLASVGANTSKNIKLIKLGNSPYIDSESEEIMTRKFLFAQSFIYYIMIWLIKTAFLTTYFHFRATIRPILKRILYLLTLFVILTFITVILVMLLTCRPLSRAWSIGPDFCSPQQKIWSHSKTAAANILTDAALMALFIAILKDLHLGRRERWGVIIFLCISAIPIFAAVLRLVIVILALDGKERERSKMDVQRFNNILYLASEVEITTAFVAACLPAMRVFFRRKYEERFYSGREGSVRGSLGGSAPRTPEQQCGSVRKPVMAFCKTPRRSTEDDLEWERRIEEDLRLRT